MIRPNSSSFQFLLGPCSIWHLPAEDQEKLVKIFVAKGLENGKLACWTVMPLPAQGELHAELCLVYEALRKLVWKEPDATLEILRQKICNSSGETGKNH